MYNPLTVNLEKIYLFAAALLCRNSTQFKTSLQEAHPACNLEESNSLELGKEIAKAGKDSIIKHITEHLAAVPSDTSIVAWAWNHFVAKMDKDMLTAGPILWRSLHTFAYNWDGDKYSALSFLRELWHRIPCGDCKIHWKELCESYEPDLSGGLSLFSWSVEAHNQVNRRLGKDEFSYQDAIRLYGFSSTDSAEKATA